MLFRPTLLSILLLLTVNATVFAGYEDGQKGHQHHALIKSFQQSANLPEGLVSQVSRWAVEGKKRQELRGWYANGVLALQAGLLQGKLDGEWRSFYMDGRPRDAGSLRRNIPDGEWKTWYASGQLKSVIHFSASKYAAFQTSLRQHNPKLAFSVAAKQAIRSPGYKDVVLAADEELPFNEGLRHGDYAVYYESGLPSELGHYTEGLKDGLWQRFLANGRPATSGYYAGGVPHGPWKNFGENGELMQLREFKSGRTVFSKNFAEGE